MSNPNYNPEARALGRTISDILQRLDDIESGASSAQLGVSSIHNSTLPFYDADGNPVASVGPTGVLLTDPNGVAQLTVDNTGGANANIVNVVDTFNYRGQEISSQIDAKSAGLKAWVQFNGGDTNVTTTSLGIAQLDFQIEAGKAYEIQASPTVLKLNTGTAGSNTCTMDLRYTLDGSDPLITSTILAKDQNQDNRAFAPSAFFYTPVAATMKVLLAFTSVGGAGIYANINVPQPLTLWLNELSSLAPPQTGRRTNGLGGGVTPQQYVTTYTSTWSRQWSDQGVLNGTNLVQGNYHDIYGDWHSLFGFNYPTIQSDLNGSTINKAELFLYCNNAVNNDGGYARLRTSNVQDPPGTFPGVSGTRLAQKFSKPGSFWIDLGTTIGDEFRLGNSRSFALDATDINPRNNADAVWFNSATNASNKPLLRITYVK